jgi:hypothetical protein
MNIIFPLDADTKSNNLQIFVVTVSGKKFKRDLRGYTHSR